MAVKDFHVPWSHLHCYWCKYRTYIIEVTCPGVFISASALTVGVVLDMDGLYISVWIQGDSEIGGHILDMCSVVQNWEEA